MTKRTGISRRTALFAGLVVALVLSAVAIAIGSHPKSSAPDESLVVGVWQEAQPDRFELATVPFRVLSHVGDTYAIAIDPRRVPTNGFGPNGEVSFEIQRVRNGATARSSVAVTRNPADDSSLIDPQSSTPTRAFGAIQVDLPAPATKPEHATPDVDLVERFTTTPGFDPND